eukprot:g3306.t1
MLKLTNEADDDKPIAKGTTLTTLSTGSETTSYTNSTIKADLGDVKFESNRTGHATSKESVHETIESEKKKYANKTTTVATTGQRVQTVAFSTSSKSSTTITPQTTGFNKTESEVEKMIQKALSQAIFETAQGGNITIQATQTAQVVTSAYADLIVAAIAEAESEGTGKTCAKVLAEIGPQAVSSSIGMALTASTDPRLAATANETESKLEAASVTISGKARAKSCASLGKSGAESFLIASAYDKTVSSIIEEILVIAQEGNPEATSKFEIETGANGTAAEIESITSTETKGKASAGSATEGSASVETGIKSEPSAGGAETTRKIHEGEIGSKAFTKWEEVPETTTETESHSPETGPSPSPIQGKTPVGFGYSGDESEKEAKTEPVHPEASSEGTTVYTKGIGESPETAKMVPMTSIEPSSGDTSGKKEAHEESKTSSAETPVQLPVLSPQGEETRSRSSSPFFSTQIPSPEETTKQPSPSSSVKTSEEETEKSTESEETRGTVPSKKTVSFEEETSKFLTEMEETERSTVISPAVKKASSPSPTKTEVEYNKTSASSERKGSFKEEKSKFLTEMEETERSTITSPAAKKESSPSPAKSETKHNETSTFSEGKGSYKEEKSKFLTEMEETERSTVTSPAVKKESSPSPTKSETEYNKTSTSSERKGSYKEEKSKFLTEMEETERSTIASPAAKKESSPSPTKSEVEYNKTSTSLEKKGSYKEEKSKFLTEMEETVPSKFSSPVTKGTKTTMTEKPPSPSSSVKISTEEEKKSSSSEQLGSFKEQKSAFLSEMKTLASPTFSSPTFEKATSPSQKKPDLSPPSKAWVWVPSTPPVQTGKLHLHHIFLL